MKVAFITPTRSRPSAGFLAAMEASVPLIEAAGHDCCSVFRVGHPYISVSRSQMFSQAIIAGADCIVSIDDDLSWRPKDLLRLIETEADVCGGTYRYRKDAEEYMGALNVDADDLPIVRPDGALSVNRLPGGFLKLTRAAVDRFSEAYPELVYGKGHGMEPGVDLFNHGAIDGVWYGEDYAFCKRWLERCGDLWLVPDLTITHHGWDGVDYAGNFHDFMLRQPGGSREGEAPAWL